MVRAPCCEKMGLKRGPWTPEEDEVLVTYIQKFGHGNWRALPKQAGLLRCGKSCRLRWTNYLRPDIKRGNFTKEEEDAIIQLHEMLGNRWSAIAARLPGRTDNEIKNVWHTHLKKRLNQNKEVITTRKAQASESKGKHRREEKRTAIAEEVNPISPHASTSNFSFSSNESSSAAACCENTTSTSSLAAAEDESSLDSVHSNMLFQFQPCDSTTFWPENLPDMDEFWSETLKEEQFGLDSGEFPADVNVHEPAFNVPLSPLPFSLYQDDSMDFWLNGLMETGQMQMTQEI